MHPSSQVALLVVFSLMSWSFSPASAASEMDSNGAASKALSRIGVAGLKLAAREDTSTNSKFYKQCVLDISDGAISDDIAPVLASKFSPAQLTEVDDFMASDAGDQLINLLLALSLPPIDGQIADLILSEASVTRITEFGRTEAGQKFRMLALSLGLDPDLKVAVQRGLRASLYKCVRQP